MMFNSIHFLIFFPIIVSLYFGIKHRYRWILLLLGSYYFYMSWKAEYVILIMISTLVDYLAGMRIYNSKSLFRKKFFLGLSLFANLGLLFCFKYFNFFSESFRTLLTKFSIPMNPITLKLLLPVGISFYTFQTLSYTIDVYREKIKPEKHLGIFAVYVSFFPQLVAGPIERAKNLLPQFYDKHHFEYQRVANGIKLMLWGFFKKVVIADRLTIVVNTVYNNPADHSGLSLVIATVFFAFQIYCDFSGYSDIAIGSAQVLGFSLMDNFKRPYSAKSIVDFWRRWHISLSSWFKDYFYIGFLGGNRVSIPRWYVNLFLVFLVSGLWHGANWTFVIWGALHGVYYVIEKMTNKFRKSFLHLINLDKFPRFHGLIQTGITFSLVCFAWIFFRANSLSDALYIASHLFYPVFNLSNIGVGMMGLLLCFALIGFLEFVHLLQKHIRMREFLTTKPIWIRWPIYSALVLLILLFGVFHGTQFIYFQF